jgi:hypothetical protein
MYQDQRFSEKVFTFVVLSFIGLIGAFNIIASLTMMMIEKRKRHEHPAQPWVPHPRWCATSSSAKAC